jgi:hypothetical protein
LTITHHLQLFGEERQHMSAYVERFVGMLVDVPPIEVSHTIV